VSWKTAEVSQLYIQIILRVYGVCYCVPDWTVCVVSRGVVACAYVRMSNIRFLMLCRSIFIRYADFK